MPPRPALNVLSLGHAIHAIGPVLVDSRRFAPFPWGPRPPMKADISTLHKPDILILRRQALIPLLTVAGPARTLGREGRFLRTCESCNQVARSIAEGSKLNEFI